MSICAAVSENRHMHMLRAVANVDRESHVEVVESGISVHIIMLSMCNTQCKTCSSRKCALYAMCMRVCALYKGQLFHGQHVF